MRPKQNYFYSDIIKTEIAMYVTLFNCNTVSNIKTQRTSVAFTSGQAGSAWDQHHEAVQQPQEPSAYQ